MKMVSTEFGKFERRLTVYVALSVVLGLFIGYLNPSGISGTLEELPEWINSTIMAIYIWLLLMPIMLRVGFSEEREKTDGVHNVLIEMDPTKLIFPLISTWVIRPLVFTYAAKLMLEGVFYGLIPPAHTIYYVAALVLLGCSPSSVSLFTLTSLVKGSEFLTRNVFSINILLMLIVFPIILYLLLPEGMLPPIYELYFTVMWVILVPLLLVNILRKIVLHHKGKAWYRNVFFPKVDSLGLATYFALIIIVFSTNSSLILSMPVVVSIIAAPLAIGMFLSFIIAFSLSIIWRLGRENGMVTMLTATVSSYEIGGAMVIALFGIASPILIAVSIYPLLEMPFIMLCVIIALKIMPFFDSARLITGGKNH